MGLHAKDQLFLSDFNKTFIFYTDFRKVLNKRLHEYPSIGIRFVPCGQTDMKDRFSQFCERA